MPAPGPRGAAYHACTTRDNASFEALGAPAGFRLAERRHALAGAAFLLR